MHDRIPIRRDLWEAHLTYYESVLLHSIECIQETMSSMQVDGFSEAADHLTTALREIEDAWSIVALEKSSSLSAKKNHGEPGGTDGAMKEPKGWPGHGAPHR